MTARVPLTFQQQWLCDLIRSWRDWNCVLSYAFRLDGELHIEMLQQSFADVLRRHGALRSRIIEADERYQLEGAEEGHLEVLAVTGDSSAQLEEKARRHFLENFSDWKLDFDADRLLRAQLLRLSEQRHWLVVAIHRVIVDCFSMDQVFRELWSLYASRRNGQSSGESPPPLQYSDYATWQRQTSVHWTQKHAGYWEKRLAGAARLQWPGDAGAGPDRRDVLGRMHCSFTEQLSAEFREFARRAHALSATAMLAVYVAVLWRRTGQKDFVVPFNVAGRQAEHKAIVGLFSHVLCLRAQLTGSESFNELLANMSGEFYRALSHQDSGRTALREPGLLSGTFFQWLTWNADDLTTVCSPTVPERVELTIQRVFVRDLEEGLTAIPPGMVDLEVTAFDTPHGIELSGVYRLDRFEPRGMQQFMDDLRTVAARLIRDPNSPLTMILRGT
jgi:hypothetical protein